MHNKPHSLEAKQKIRESRTGKRKFNLPELEIVDRLLNSVDTTRSVAKEYNCSDSTIKIIFRNHSTKEQRLACKYRKQSHSLKKNGNWFDNKIAEVSKSMIPFKGKKHTNESKLKQSNAKVGKKHSMEQRIAHSASLQGISIREWKGWASTESDLLKGSSDWKKWRNLVFERDKYTCRECGKRGVKLHPHHIKPKSTHKNLIFCIDNGITLCEECHRKTDSYGVKKKEQLGLGN